jgi:phosphate transport system protein
MADSKDFIRSFDQELLQLDAMLAEMGGIVESQMALATEAITEMDADVAQRCVDLDPKTDALEQEIEQFVIRVLALRQPLAGDLRRVVAALKITSALERIGDYAANAAKRSIVLAQQTLPFSLAAMANMARLVQANLKRVIDAVQQNDADLALEVWRSDKEIDDLYTAIFRELITYMMEDPRNITPCTHLLFIAKNLERVGDHATNIAETVYYTVRGETLTGARPKGGSSYTANQPPGGE